MTRSDQKRVTFRSHGRVSSALLGAALLCGAFTLSPRAAELQAGTHGVAAARSQLFPTPERGLTIRAGGLTTRKGGQSLAGLLDEFAEVTGERLLYGPQTARLLDSIEIPLSAALDVAPDDVYTVVQNILAQHGFAFGDVRRQEPRMLSVVSLESRDREVAWSPARFVPVEQLDDYAEDSALIISTILSLPDVDARSMGVSLRQLVVDPSAMQIIPLPNSGQVILTGYCPIVHANVQLLRGINEGAAQSRERRK